jgi:hypothetical protein
MLGVGMILVIVLAPILLTVLAVVVVVKVARWMLALLWVVSLVLASLVTPLLRPRSPHV